MTFIFLISCLPTPASQMEGQITDGDGTLIPNATIEIRDEFANIYTQGQADESGIFSIELPPFQTFFTVVSAESYITSSFTGYAGEGDFIVPPGTLWLRTSGEIESTNVDFSSCFPTTTGLIDGELRVAISGQDPDTLPIVTTGKIYLIDEENTTIDACYLPTIDDEEEEEEEATEEDPTISTQTGESGRYAFFDIEEGLYILRATIFIEEVETHRIDYVVYVPEDGTVPLYPTLISL